MGVSGINCKIVSGAWIHVLGGKDWKLFILMIWSLIFIAILFECFRKKYNFSHPANYLGKKGQFFYTIYRKAYLILSLYSSLGK